MGTHILEKLQKLIDKDGKICLLPQNLPLDILKRIEEEAIAIKNEYNDPPASVLFLAVLILNNEEMIMNGGELEIKPEVLMDNFYVYSSSVRLEILRREGKIDIAEESMPTIENILDGNRILAVSGSKVQPR